jgi:hypothetical protein
MLDIRAILWLEDYLQVRSMRLSLVGEKDDAIHNEKEVKTEGRKKK